jgi:hypothetical protein
VDPRHKRAIKRNRLFQNVFMPGDTNRAVIGPDPFQNCADIALRNGTSPERIFSRIASS